MECCQAQCGQLCVGSSLCIKMNLDMSEECAEMFGCSFSRESVFGVHVHACVCVCVCARMYMHVCGPASAWLVELSVLCK